MPATELAEVQTEPVALHRFPPGKTQRRPLKAETPLTGFDESHVGTAALLCGELSRIGLSVPQQKYGDNNIYLTGLLC